ncbi:Adarb1, partial [Symbiodinium sp. CCMP2456]
PNSKPKLRNAEKDRRATCAFADEIALAALAEWRLRRPADFEPRQTVLAAFLALRLGELFVVSLGVGTKFRGAEADTSAQSLRDLHAEVLARRALKRFLHQDLCRCLGGAHGELLSRVASDRFALREDTSLHLYTTSVPCGNAAWKRWAKGGSTCPKLDADTKTEWPKQLHPKIHLHARHEGQASFLAKAAVSVPDAETPAGTEFLQAWGSAKQGPLTCSDKIATWAAMGLAGNALSAVLEPVRLSTCTIGRKFSWPHAARALCCRLQNFTPELLKELPRGYGLQHLDLLGCSVKFDDGIYEDGSGADFSDPRCLAWTRGDEAPEILDGRTGRLVGGEPSTLSSANLTELSRLWKPQLPEATMRERQDAHAEAKQLLRGYVDER